jgi:hypothetical protein
MLAFKLSALGKPNAARKVGAGGAEQRNVRSALFGEHVPAEAAQGKPAIPATANEGRRQIAAARPPLAPIDPAPSGAYDVSLFHVACTVYAER